MSWVSHPTPVILAVAVMLLIILSWETRVGCLVPSLTTVGGCCWHLHSWRWLPQILHPQNPSIGTFMCPGLYLEFDSVCSKLPQIVSSRAQGPTCVLQTMLSCHRPQLQNCISLWNPYSNNCPSTYGVHSGLLSANE